MFILNLLGKVTKPSIDASPPTVKAAPRNSTFKPPHKPIPVDKASPIAPTILISSGDKLEPVSPIIFVGYAFLNFTKKKTNLFEAHF